MQPKSMLRLTSLLVVVCLIFAHCKKGDPGDTGPAGPAGAPGAPGSQGAQGNTGTANVIYSAWLDVQFAQDTDPNGPPNKGYSGLINATKLTSAILTSGDMKVYMNFGTTAQPDVVPLPLSDPFYEINITVDYFPQQILLYANGNASTYTDTDGKHLQYRYVLIPGGVPARMANIDWNDYNKVKETLGLKD